ncbi:hypothetical protein C343_00797 [Cryptococcus neoformans C23]|uniref:Uncharacterized protein n=2 Tax=Cryptococcus neoformans TaxID=5207 RepID=A0A854QPE9_CRYNE|nr:hypothetical protein CNAG_00783 [Cryptococcus neoformans var. grubii H99]AUB22395.1 hypothetical protein CKF44_00783 [Cryptococcus neoformans var. grubii]OWZ36697.1 hypothetical protein C347_00873 [Cryptococcus neoformans var. grubii AD2-60a]OWZ48367.1 hypothetical protein C343_00797 [Cryptococcus neoformans var. grubii C23]OWZ55375.1 hypothetical protein C353_00804 [Cryptococcus neoformans var. grubii AD1-83a]OWZ58137.1 hypothetical protein C368_01311 [Cryptococcus neoformans var. grubii 1|eukprot:XP_012046428.1 hypothetical protein CNAG_00783 [Cryptococcus neoformans var. grubii H99]
MPRESENDRSKDYRENDRESRRKEHDDERYRPRSERDDRDGGRERRMDRSGSMNHDRDRGGERDRDSRRRHRDSESHSPSRHRHAKNRDDDRQYKPKSSRRRSRSVSSSDSSDYSSDSESEDERRRRKRKERKRKREKEEKEERRRRKEKKKAKRDKKKRETAASTHSWGQYGIISEIDLPKKDSEFRAWLVEERKINPETISKDRTKKEFAVYVEDYNTATLGHEKYYDMEKYMVKLNMIRSGQTLPDESNGYDPMADMKAHSSSLKSKTNEPQESYLSPQEVAELRRIEAERTEISKRRLLGMNVPKNMGVRTEDADY